MTARNFCSNKCAAIVINPQTGLKLRKIRNCKYCQKNFFYKNQNYCSLKCWAKSRRIPNESILKEIQKLAKELDRTPTRRECKQADSAIKYFSSWNNAIIAAGLKPHRSKSQRMYQRIQTYAKDGHYCYSISEVLIDNWLKNHGFNHQKEVPYPENKFIADWSIRDKKIFIEYFGLAGDVKNYDLTIEKKRAICAKHGIKLIELYAQDLFPDRNLDNRLYSLNLTN
jgi:hypothetical protein